MRHEQFMKLLRTSPEGAARGGAGLEYPEMLTEYAFLSAKFLEPFDYIENSQVKRLFSCAPADMSERLPEISAFLDYIEQNIKTFLRWVSIHATAIARKRFRGPKGKSEDSEDVVPREVRHVAQQVLIRLWNFFSNLITKKAKKKGEPSSMERWYFERPRTFADFQTQVQMRVFKGVSREYDTLYSEPEVLGMYEAKASVKRSRKQWKRYEEAVQKGRTRHINGEPIVRPDIPKKLIVGAGLTKDDTDSGGGTYEVLLDESPSHGQQSRVYDQSFEVNLNAKLGVLAESYYLLLLWLGPLEVLKAKVIRIREEMADISPDAPNAEGLRLRLVSNEAEIIYQNLTQVKLLKDKMAQIRAELDAATPGSANAEALRIRLTDIEEEAQNLKAHDSGKKNTRESIARKCGANEKQMESTWKTSKETFTNRLKKQGIPSALESVGLTILGLVEQLEAEHYVAEELIRHLESNEESRNV